MESITFVEIKDNNQKNQYGNRHQHQRNKIRQEKD